MKKIFLLLIALLLCHQFSYCQTNAAFQQMLSEINADSIRATVQDLQDFPSRFAIHGNKDAAQYIIHRLNQYGIANAAIDSFPVNVDYSWLANGAIHQYMYNVKGSLTGSAYSDSILILGAHYDCVTMNEEHSIIYDTTEGADDNASGVAVMLEIARILHLHQFVPRYTVDFMAYDGEEFGLYGSQYDAQKRNQNHDKVKIMLNNDMVANDPNNQGKMTIYWYDNSLTERSDAALMCDNFTTLTPVIYDIAGNGLSHNSDSYAYYLQGFHAIFAIENEFSPYYHGPLDITSQYNYHFTAEVAKMNLAMLIHYASHDVFSLPDAIAEYDNAIITPSIYPNPASNQSTLSFYLTNDENVTISLFNISGQRVYLSNTVQLSSGFNHIELTVNQLTSGIYFCKIQTENGSKTVKLIKQ